VSVSVRATITPVVLVVVAAGAVAYAWLVDRGSVSDAERASRRSDVFPSFHVEDVTHVELVHGDETLVLDRGRDAGGASSAWTMTSPRHEHADAGAVDALLRELALASRVRGVSDGDAVGLDEPRVRGLVRVGALEWRFVLGADAPRPEGAAYMRLEGEGTFVVQRSLKVQLLRGTDAYRPRAILPYGASDVQRIHVATAPDGGFTLERQRAGGPTFRVVEDGMRASRETMDRVLTALTEARAESFVDDAEGDRAAPHAAFAVSVEPTDAARPRIALMVAGSCPGQPADDLLIETVPTRLSACIARTLGDALRDAKLDLDDASPFFAHADEMEEVRLEPLGVAGPRVDLSRKGAGWHERAPEDRDLSSDETDSANALALALASARGSQVRRAAEAFVARARATIVRTGGSSTEVVELGAAEADGSLWVRRADDGAFVRLAAPQARRFEPHPAALRPRALWHSPFDPGAVVGIDDTCGPVPEKLVLRDGTWTMLAPTGFAADPIAVTDLAGAVAHAKADAWITESDDGSFGLGRAGDGACAVTLALAAPDGGPSRSVTLSLGADAGGGAFYARASDDAAVFVASGVLRALAAHPAIDRNRFRLDPRSLDSVTVVHEPGDHRRAVALDADAPGALAKAVEGLYAEAALHTGAPGKNEGMDHPTLELIGPGVHVSIGAPASVDGIDGYYARAAGVDATFIVPKHAVSAIVAAMGD
jgi:hypothetical protein